MPRLPLCVFVVILSTGACGSSAPAESPARSSPEQPPAPAPSTAPAPLVAPDEVQRPGAIWPPPGYEPPPCELELSTSAVRRGSAYEITAYARNVSKRTITFELPDRCPGGPASFYGLPGSYDYHRTCTKGACAEHEPKRFSASAGQRIEIDAVTVDVAGSSCNQPLPAGRHHVAFTIPYRGATCPGSWAAVDQRSPAPKPAPPLPKTAPDPGVKCPDMPTCGLACPNGAMARDARGCLLCACEERRGVVPTAPPPPQ